MSYKIKLLPLHIQNNNINLLEETNMTLQEFKDRTGLTPSDEEFNYIHALYMNTALDKDEFCEDFKKHGMSTIMKEVHSVATNFKIRYESKLAEMKELAYFLLGKACVYDDPDLYEEASRLVGQKEVTLYKLKNSLPLWEEDMDFIRQTLEKV